MKCDYYYLYMQLPETRAPLNRTSVLRGLINQFYIIIIIIIGAAPARQLRTRKQSLNSIRCLTGSQCSVLRMAAEIWLNLSVIFKRDELAG